VEEPDEVARRARLAAQRERLTSQLSHLVAYGVQKDIVARHCDVLCGLVSSVSPRPRSQAAAAAQLIEDAITRLEQTDGGDTGKQLRFLLRLDTNPALTPMGARKRVIDATHTAMSDRKFRRTWQPQLLAVLTDTILTLASSLSEVAPPPEQGQGTQDGDYISEYVQIVYRFGRKSHVPTDVRTLRVIRALTDGVETFHASSWHATDHSAGATRLEVLWGGVLNSEPVEDGPGYYVQTISIPKMRHDTLHVVSTRRHIVSDAEPAAYYYLEPLRDVKAFRLTVQFNVEDLPELVWRFEGLRTRQVPGRWTPSTALPVSPDGESEWLFGALEAHRSYGIGWTWKSGVLE